MAAEAQLLLDLFDSFWFAHQILKNPPNPPPQIPKNEESVAETIQNLDLSAIPTINVRSYSDELFNNSPNSIMNHQILKNPQIPKTEESVAKTIQNLDLSDIPTINVRSYSDELFNNSPNSIMNHQIPELKVEEHAEIEVKLPVMEKNRGERKRRKNLVRSKSKSLSELEFEELKGLMDLGFMFSEKDKDSSLVSIVPGLQRLGKDEKEQVPAGYANVSRPYLSEAWGDLERMKEEAPRLITISALENESDMKHQLRFWAHSVASVVR